MEQVAIMLQDMRAEIRSLNTRIDRLTLVITLQDMRAEIRALNARIDQLNTRIDRLTLLSWVSAAGSSSP
jgi:outer membrane murein-binding lipoprotein Lpp